MMKRFLAFAAAAVMLAAAIAVPSTADAQGRAERQFFRALGTGVAVGAGLVFGANAARLLAPEYRAYAPEEGYVVYQGYGVAAPVGCPGGFWARRCTRTDVFGNCTRFSNPKFFCPPPGYVYY